MCRSAENCLLQKLSPAGAHAFLTPLFGERSCVCLRACRSFAFNVQFRFRAQQAHHRYCCAVCTESAACAFLQLCSRSAVPGSLPCSHASGVRKCAQCIAAVNMAYSCPSKAVFSGPRTLAHAHQFVTVRKSALRPRAIDVAQRRPPVGHHTKLMTCKAVSEPAAENKLQVSVLRLLHTVICKVSKACLLCPDLEVSTPVALACSCRAANPSCLTRFWSVLTLRSSSRRRSSSEQTKIFRPSSTTLKPSKRKFFESAPRVQPGLGNCPARQGFCKQNLTGFPARQM